MTPAYQPLPVCPHRNASLFRRYLSDNVTKLSMGLMGRMLTTNDFPMALVALLDKPPWSRRRAAGGKARLEKWVDNGWQPVAPADRLKLTQSDAQVCVRASSLPAARRSRSRRRVRPQPLTPSPALLPGWRRCG